MSAFTDEDLKQLKKMLDPKGIEHIVGRALLARLEAAEKALAQTKTFRRWVYDHLAFSLCDEQAYVRQCWNLDKALVAWRKACGVK